MSSAQTIDHVALVAALNPGHGRLELVELDLRRAAAPSACPWAIPFKTSSADSPGLRPRRFLSSRTIDRRRTTCAAEPAVLDVVVVASVAGMPMTPMARRGRASAARRRGRRRRSVGFIISVDELGQPAHAVDVVAVVEDDLVAVDLEISLSRPGAWKNDVVNVRSPWRMSCRCAPAAHAAAAAASALATFMRARPSNVAGIRCVYSSGIVRSAWRSTTSSPSSVCCTTIAAPPRPQWPSTRSEASSPAARHREVDDAAAALARHPRDERIVGVEHGRARARHRLDDDRLDVRQLRHRLDAAQAEVVAGHVGHDGDVVAVVAEALAQDAAARDLEHRRVDRRVLEHHLRRARARHVALPDQPAVDDDAVGRGHAHAAAHQLQDVADHAHGRRLAVGAGHADDRDARVRARREEQVDDRLGDVLRLALGRVACASGSPARR